MIATPDAADCDNIGALPGLLYKQLLFPGKMPDIAIDRWTAVLLLFHDHHWETALLADWLLREPFYVGALAAGQHVKAGSGRFWTSVSRAA